MSIFQNVDLSVIKEKIKFKKKSRLWFVICAIGYDVSVEYFFTYKEAYNYRLNFLREMKDFNPQCSIFESVEVLKNVKL